MQDPKIKKILRIEGIGKFRSCKPHGDVELRDVSLIYAENGRGKTTLCDILRSLQSGDASAIGGRETLGPSGKPKVEIRTDTGTATFLNGAWSETIPEVYVYDSKFVHENVYAGEIVDHEQKRNLLRIIVGEKGVQLAETVDAIDEELRDLDKQIRTARTEVTELAPAGMSADQYVALEERPDIEEKLSAKLVEVSSLRRAEEIVSKERFERLPKPQLPESFATVLSKKVEDLSSETEKRVRDHVENHTSSATEPWIAQGISYMKDSTCPFCQQGVSGSDLVSAFSQYFGEAYKALKAEVSTMADELAVFGSDISLMSVEQSLASNQELVEFWKQFADFNAPKIDFDELKSGITNLRSVAIAYAEKKKAEILEPVTLSDDYDEASKRFNQAIATVDQVQRNRCCCERTHCRKKSGHCSGRSTSS